MNEDSFNALMMIAIVFTVLSIGISSLPHFMDVWFGVTMEKVVILSIIFATPPIIIFIYLLKDYDKIKKLRRDKNGV